ncbi:MAG: dihydrolipoyl dehydrogenase [Spirochaetales bacterium]|nr:dihydrolipoyl dehydrogenase [Spirochaetales bacterium]
MEERSFDLVVLGAGPGGYVAAIRAAQLGLSVAVVEKDNPGGVCLNIGCIPSKSLIHNATLFYEAVQMLRKGGATIDLSTFDYGSVWKASRLAADRLSKGVNFLLKKNKVALIKGRGRLLNAGTVQVQMAEGEILLRARSVILATGSRPRAIPGFEFDEQYILSSTGMLLRERLPASLVILGAGAIGMEFAYVMQSFGVKVTVVELLPRVLPLEDEEASKILDKVFKARGIAIHTGARATGAERTEHGIIVHLVDAASNPVDIEAEAVLVAIGRAPNTEDLGLEALGVRMEKGYILTGEYHETSCAGIYAIGDITTYPQLAHTASKAGEIAAERIAHLLKGTPNPHMKTLDRNRVPSAVYCEPEVASFGVSEAKAKELGLPHAVARFPYRGNGRAVATESAEGQVKLVFEPETHRILGASIVGSGAADLIHELLLAAEAELSVEDVAAMVHAHPTISETIMEAAKAALGQAIHI